MYNQGGVSARHLGEQGHCPGQSHPEVPVEHLAAHRNSAQVHIEAHQAQGLPVHRELLGQLGRDLQSLGHRHVDEPLPDVRSRPVPRIQGQAVGTHGMQQTCGSIIAAHQSIVVVVGGGVRGGTDQGDSAATLVQHLVGVVQVASGGRGAGPVAAPQILARVHLREVQRWHTSGVFRVAGFHLHFASARSALVLKVE